MSFSQLKRSNTDADINQCQKAKKHCGNECVDNEWLANVSGCISMEFSNIEYSAETFADIDFFQFNIGQYDDMDMLLADSEADAFLLSDILCDKFDETEVLAEDVVAEDVVAEVLAEDVVAEVLAEDAVAEVLAEDVAEDVVAEVLAEDVVAEVLAEDVVEDADDDETDLLSDFLLAEDEAEDVDDDTDLLSDFLLAEDIVDIDEDFFIYFMFDIQTESGLKVNFDSDEVLAIAILSNLI